MRSSLPLQVGTVIDCKHPGKEEHFIAAKILEWRVAELGGESEYYVHFLGEDKRWDRWINLQAMDLSSSTMKIPDLLGEDNSATPPAPIIGQLSAGSLLQDSTETLAFIKLGRYEMRTDFMHEQLGLREDLRNAKTLWISEYDLEIFSTEEQSVKHIETTFGDVNLRHPPGRQIYAGKSVSVWSLDGGKDMSFCKNLVCLGSFFLEIKPMVTDLANFIFFVVCFEDQIGHHMVGYFSKEKQSEAGCNLASILIFPPYQRKGYGKFLISMSYELSKMEGEVGGPQRPLTRAALAAYQTVWKSRILKVLRLGMGTVALDALSQDSGIMVEDIRRTLQEELPLIKYYTGLEAVSTDLDTILRYEALLGPLKPELDPARMKVGGRV